MKKLVPAALVFVLISLLAFAASPSVNPEDSSPIKRAGEYEPFVVLELFTSQGCSSCPAADRLLHQIKSAARENVIPLSYHVDYWNYIGWEDPYSSANFTRKQSLYNHKFKNRGNYTPQLVINGKEHLVGSDKTRLLPRMDSYKHLKALNEVGLSDVLKSENKVSFIYSVSGAVHQKNIKALLVLDQRETLVERGENRSRKLLNSNIVLLEQIENLSSNSGKMSLSIPKNIGKEEVLHLVVLIENQNYDITAARKVTL